LLFLTCLIKDITSHQQSRKNPVERIMKTEKPLISQRETSSKNFEILSCHMGFCELFELFSVMKPELFPNQNFA
jgi:hypothetical protein